MRKLMLCLWPFVAVGCVSFQEDPFHVDGADEREPDPLPTTPSSESPAEGGAPSAPACPVECSAGCEGALCRIDCSAGCRDQKLACPAGHDCSLVCEGKETCRGTELRCTAGQSCDWGCAGKDACRGSHFFCEGAECTRSCAGAGSCDESELRCSGAALCQLACEPPNDKNSGVSLFCDPTASCDAGACATVPH